MAIGIGTELSDLKAQSKAERLSSNLPSFHFDATPMEALSSTWFKVLLFYACFWYVCVFYLAQKMYVQQKQDCIANSVSAPFVLQFVSSSSQGATGRGSAVVVNEGPQLGVIK